MISVYRAPTAGPAGWAPRLVHQQSDRQVFQVRKVQQGALLLRRLIGPGEILHQVQQPPSMAGVNQRHIRQQGALGPDTVWVNSSTAFLHRARMLLICSCRAGSSTPGSFELGKDNLPPPPPHPSWFRLPGQRPPGSSGGLEAVPAGLFQPRLFLGQVTGPGHLVRPIGGGLAGLPPAAGCPRGSSHIGHRRQVQGFRYGASQAKGSG